ncbi:MAG: hypothetical protein KJO31_12045 [Gammaproteobacteria bacterium]|nr:hypothetical protein [Gammaproteobacteria bacterium]
MDTFGKTSVYCFEQAFPAEIADKVSLSGSILVRPEDVRLYSLYLDPAVTDSVAV